MIHIITNGASRPLVAQALAAIGASPIMAEAEEEAIEISSAALVINLGMPTQARLAAMRCAVQSARRRDRPWVLDTVAAGVSHWRYQWAHTFLKMQPHLLRVNLTEAALLAQAYDESDQFLSLTQEGYGIDMKPNLQANESDLCTLATRYGVTVAASGNTDYINDGRCQAQLQVGHPDMTAVIGLGCTATALSGAFLGAGASSFEAGTAALLMLGLAGEQAAMQAKGPASLALCLIDSLAAIKPRDLETAHDRITLFFR